MAYVRLTVLRPLPGRGNEALSLLRQIDGMFSRAPGLVGSLLFRRRPAAGCENYIGRLSVWETEADANRAALDDRTLALRSRLLMVTREQVVETLAEADAGWWSLTSALAQKAGVPARSPSFAAGPASRTE